MMRAHRVTLSDPEISASEDNFLDDLAAFLKAQGITTQAGWETFVNGLTAAQLLTVMKALLKRWVKVAP